MKKNVLELIGSFQQGGSERQAVQLSRLLHDEGTVKVYVGCLDSRGGLREELHWIEADDIPEFHLTSFHDVNFLRQAARCARYIKANDIALVHTHDFYTNIFGMCAAFLAGIPGRIASKRETFSKTKAQMLLERQAFRLAAQILANAKTVKAFLVDTGVPEGKVTVVYNGIDLKRMASSGRERLELLGTFGLPDHDRLQIVTIVANLRSDVKNHHMFLRAARQVLDSCGEAVFIIAGEGELTESLKIFAEELGIARQVFFTGACREVANLLSISDVCVLSSKSEGFSNSILEYMSAGKPVVATRVGGAAEAVIEGETGFLVEADDDKTMAERIIILLQSPGLAARFGSRGLEVIKEKFTVGRQLSKTLKLYNAVWEKKLVR